MQKVITFGELMLRFAPPNYLRFVQTDTFEATFGGAEANVEVSLANYNIDTVDLGVPVLSMHAPFEITSKLDNYMAYKAFRVFFEDK